MSPERAWAMRCERHPHDTSLRLEGRRHPAAGAGAPCRHRRGSAEHRRQQPRRRRPRQRRHIERPEHRAVAEVELLAVAASPGWRTRQAARPSAQEQQRAAGHAPAALPRRLAAAGRGREAERPSPSRRTPAGQRIRSRESRAPSPAAMPAGSATYQPPAPASRMPPAHRGLRLGLGLHASSTVTRDPALDLLARRAAPASRRRPPAASGGRRRSR